MLQNNQISGTFFGHIGERENTTYSTLPAYSAESSPPPHPCSRAARCAPTPARWWAPTPPPLPFRPAHRSGSTIWSTFPSAAMARAAMQLTRMAQLDSPSGIDLPGLDLQHRLHRHRHPVWYFPLNRKAWAPNPLFCLTNLTDAAVPWIFCHFPIQFQWVLNVDFWYTHFSLKFNPSSSKSNSDQPWSVVEMLGLAIPISPLICVIVNPRVYTVGGTGWFFFIYARSRNTAKRTGNSLRAPFARMPLTERKRDANNKQIHSSIVNRLMKSQNGSKRKFVLGAPSKFKSKRVSRRKIL